VRDFCVFLENDKTDLRQIFFQGFGENTCSTQLALKITAPGLKQWRLRTRCSKS